MSSSGVNANLSASSLTNFDLVGVLKVPRGFLRGFLNLNWYSQPICELSI